MNKCRKNNNKFKILKLKIEKRIKKEEDRKRKKERKLHRTAELNIDVKVYNKNKKCD